MPYQLCQPVVDLGVRALCTRTYSNHSKGCPNFGKKKGCPPDCLTVDKIIDLDKPVWAIWNVFDFVGHCKKMQQKHPNWSKRQIECCLYWQPKARNALKDEIAKFCIRQPVKQPLVLVKNPEGAGVNLTETMRQIDINLEWPPKTITYQIVLAGMRR